MLEESEIQKWDDATLLDKYGEIEDRLDADPELTGAARMSLINDSITLNEEMMNRDIPKEAKKNSVAEAKKKRIAARENGATLEPVKKFREDSAEQRAADAQREQTRSDMDRGKDDGPSLPLSLAEERIIKRPKLPPLSDFNAVRKLLDQEDKPLLSERTEHEKLSENRMSWEMLPQLADYAESVYSVKYYESVRQYLTSAGAARVRNQLSGRADSEEAKKTVEALDRVTDMELPDHTLLFRGMAVDPDGPIANLKPGDTFHDPSFVSTSVKETEAQYFSRINKDEVNTQRLVFEIETRPGFKGAPLYAIGADGLSRENLVNMAYGEEAEVLLKRDVTFEVLETTDLAGIRRIRLAPISQYGTDLRNE